MTAFNSSFSHFPYLVLLIASLLLGLVLKSTNSDSNDYSKTSKFIYLTLGIIIIFGAAIRLYGLDFGFPRFYHPDERKKIHVISKMFRRDTFDPDYFFHPSLLLYLTIAVTKLTSWLGISHTLFFDPSFDGNLKGSLRILFSGRLVSAIAGTLSIPMLFACARNLFPPRVALLSAALLTVSPLHITCSRYLKEDSLLTFFMLVVIYFISRFINTRDNRHIYLASFFIGVSLASKYTGILLIVPLFFPFLIVERNYRRQFLSTIMRSLALVPIGFFLCSPYSFISLAQSSGGIIAEARHAATGHHGLVISPISEWFLFHFSRTIIPGAGVLVVILAMIAVGSYIRRPSKNISLIMVMFLLFYFSAELIPSKPFPQPDRYILPCIPLLSILAASIILKFKNTFAISVLAVCLVFFPLQRSLSLAWDIKNDTRKQATAWMVENLEKPSKFLTFGGSVYLCHIPQRHKSTAARKVIGTEKIGVAKRLAESNYDYLIYSHFAQSRFEVSPHPAPERKAAMDEIKRSFKLAKQVTAPSGSYGFHNPTIEIYDLRSYKPDGY